MTASHIAITGSIKLTSSLPIRKQFVLLQEHDQNMNSKDGRHEKTALKVFVVAIPKEGWARVAAPILLLV